MHDRGETFGVVEAEAVVARLADTFDRGRTRPVEWRQRQLDGLLRLLTEQDGKLVDAMASDLGRPRFEGWMADIAFTAKDVGYLRKHVARWAADEKVRPPLQLAATRTKIVREPLGVVLVIAPWNYPVQLSLAPLAAALAAGNAVCLKPSELAPATSALLAEQLPRYLDRDAVAVVEGAVVETTALLEQRWDHVFYTGNGRVGRIVAAAAARHLTPVTLELGGKSPVIVDADADLEVAATRIVWAKFLNAGQTCVAPDYVLAHDDVHDRLVELMADVVRAQRGDDPRTSTSYGRIVDQRHAERLVGLLDAGGYGAVAVGGEHDAAARYVDPTVLADVERDAAVMREEIFGPILPVLRVRDVDDATAFVRAGDKPLALYVFTGSDEVADRVLRTTSSGGVGVNDVMTHLLPPGLPFGGVGPSGTGAYHGRWGFELFSHRKSVLERPTWFEMAMLYPPYTNLKERVTRRLF